MKSDYKFTIDHTVVMVIWIPFFILMMISCGKQSTQGESNKNKLNPGDIPTYVFGPWTHEHEQIGEAQDVPGIWKNTIFNDPPTPQDGTMWEITDKNPIIEGEKYFHTTLNKIGDNLPTHRRTERRFLTSNQGDSLRQRNFIDLGNDQWRAREKIWYGFLMRIDQAGEHGPRGFYCQWHSPNTVKNSSSPVIAIRGSSGSSSNINGLCVFRKERENNAEQGDYTTHYSETFLQDEWEGVTHAYIFEVLWDSRKSEEGSEGIFRLYIDDNPAPVYEFNGDRNVTYGVEETTNFEDFNPGNPNAVQEQHPYFQYGNYNVGSYPEDEGVFIQSHTNFTVMGEDGSREAMLDALQYGDIHKR